MRLRVVIGGVASVFGLGGFCLGLMKYAFTGFPFGGSEAILAEGHSLAVIIMAPSAILFAAGVAFVVTRKGRANCTPRG